jgi:glycosyltransferase involved in cell wall biosynthesis
VARALAREIAQSAPGALYLDHLDSLVYAPLAGTIPLVVDMHNVYSRLVARAGDESRGRLRRSYLAAEARLLVRMEQRVAEMAHTVLAVSEEEAEYFRALGARRTVLVPNGVDCDAFGGLPLAGRIDPPTLMYVGSLAWPPNASAARFLATEVLPAVRARVPAARLLIVGRDPLPEVLALAGADTRVEIAANVADVMPYFRRAHVLTVPLQAGGGTRLKILEAFAAGVPVVSTRVGCEGLGAVDGRHLVIAERDEFVAATVALLHDPRRARALAEQARVLARQRFDWSIVGARAADAVLAASARARFEKRELPVEQARGVAQVRSVPRS